MFDSNELGWKLAEITSRSRRISMRYVFLHFFLHRAVWGARHNRLLESCLHFYVFILVSFEINVASSANEIRDTFERSKKNEEKVDDEKIKTQKYHILK